MATTHGNDHQLCLDNDSQAGAMLTRKKGRKKHPSHTGAFRNSSTSFRVQSGARGPEITSLPTPQTPSNALGLDFEGSFEMPIADAEWGPQQDGFGISGPSQSVIISIFSEYVCA